MMHTTLQSAPSSPRWSRRRPAARRAGFSPAPLALVAGLAIGGAPAGAVDFGPFSLTGFAKAEIRQTTNVCQDCQRELGEARHRLWADDIAFGKPFGTRESHVTLFQPYLGFKQDVGRGWQAFGLLSQRWRDGSVDLPGWLYERNVGVTHEDWGRLTIGAMTTRGWSVPDYPSSFNAISSDFWGGGGGATTPAWSDSGAAYGMLSRAVRYMSRPIEVPGGDVLLEATYDIGKAGWTRNKPQFLELYAKYIARDLLIDVIVQQAKNGEPVAWGKAPFGGLTPFSADDPLLGSSSQGMAMLMARHVVAGKVELSGGVRFNRWSGAYAVQTTPGALGRWNSMFNVDWGGTDANGIANPGYAARSTDWMLGARYRLSDKMTLGGSLVRLGKASTANPSERGQGNTLTAGNLTLGYSLHKQVQVYATAGAYEYGRLGPAPLSVPAHDAFTGIDSRVARRGNSLGMGVTVTF